LRVHEDQRDTREKKFTFSGGIDPINAEHQAPSTIEEVRLGRYCELSFPPKDMVWTRLGLFRWKIHKDRGDTSKRQTTLSGGMIDEY
jgi:hypothetical protein